MPFALSLGGETSVLRSFLVGDNPAQDAILLCSILLVPSFTLRSCCNDVVILPERLDLVMRKIQRDEIVEGK